MKLATPALMAILATSVFANTIPHMEAATSEFGLVKKADVSDALSIIEELGRLNQKRELVEDETELFELTKRADSLLAELLSALTSSGIIGNVWNALTSDTALRSELISLVKSALLAAVTKGPALIEAVWKSGLLQKFFSAFWNDSSLRSALFSSAKVIFGSGLNLLKAFLAQKTSSTTTTTAAAAAATTAAAKRELVAAAIASGEYYDKRDLLSVAETVYAAIKNSGIVLNLVKKALSDPEASILLLTSVFKKGLVVAEDIYSWTKSSGILQSAITWIGAHGGTFAKEVASFLGSKIVSGEASVSDIDGASTTTASVTATASATTIAFTAAATAAAAATANAAAGATVNLATTLVKRRLY